MAAALNGGKTPPSITRPFSNRGAQSSSSGAVPATSAQADAPTQADAQIPLPITAGLGDEVNKLIALSPSLQNDLKNLDDQGWTIRYTADGDENGAYAKRDKNNPHIVIDKVFQNNPTLVAQILAHEVGHATYDYKPDYSTEANYVNGTLADEGMAAITNIRVQREIIAGGGPDIGVNGPSSQDEYDFYNRTYDHLQSGRIDLETARNSIGETFRHKTASTTGKTYEETFGGWYRDEYLPWFEEQRDQDRKGRINGNH